MNVYKIENLTKVYGKGESEVKAINNVSFKVNEGEFIAIIGPSGSGKSTLLHSLAGLEKPSTGHIYFYNEDLYKYIKCPKIISFIKMVKDKDINLSNYLDINELIKGIYRSVEGK